MRTINVFTIGAAFLCLLTPSAVSADTADDVKCTGCVGSPDILDFGIKTKDLGVGAVTTPKINDGAVSWKKLASDLQQRIEQLEATVAALESMQLDNTVLKLDGYLDLDTTDPAKPTALFSGVNVQVVNGAEYTDNVNGLGNLIIGYDEDYGSGYAICSDGAFTLRESCENAGEIWSLEHKSGSHNVVIGIGHRYSQHGGLLAGSHNAANRSAASVTGGNGNLASGERAVVVGGLTNVAAGSESVVSGGYSNCAVGSYSVVSGGKARHSNDIYDWAAGELWQDQ